MASFAPPDLRSAPRAFGDKAATDKRKKRSERSSAGVVVQPAAPRHLAFNERVCVRGQFSERLQRLSGMHTHAGRGGSRYYR